MNVTCPDDLSLCTVKTCSLQCGEITFQPTLAGNGLYLALLVILLLLQLTLGIRYRTWGFMVGMCSGLLLEAVGYAGRLMLHDNPFSFNNFLTYLIPLTIGPAFISGSIYLCLARVVVACGRGISRIAPKTYIIIFMGSDFTALLLQGAGGGIAATAETRTVGNAGRYTMIAGLCTQVLSLLVFMILCLEFYLRLRQVPRTMKEGPFGDLTTSRRFKAFANYGLWIATTLILIRSVYRIVELQAGFQGTVASNEVAFMVLEGPMIITATLVLTVLHPGFAFQGHWQSANWAFKGKE